MARGTLKLNPAAVGLEDAKAQYRNHHEQQGTLIVASWASVGLAAVSGIYGTWSYFSAEDTGRWESFLVDEAPQKGAKAAPAK